MTEVDVIMLSPPVVDTCSLEAGLVVPMPTLPPFSPIIKLLLSVCRCRVFPALAT